MFDIIENCCVKENIKISAKDSLGLYEWKQHKTLFDEDDSKFLHQSKQARKAVDTGSKPK